MKRGEIKTGNAQTIASEIYGLICSCLVYKTRSEKELDVMKLYKEFENTIIEGFNSRLDKAEDWISKLEDKAMELT